MPQTNTPLRIRDLLREDIGYERLPLIERQAELDRLARRLRQRRHNNLIITGPAGCGKTALFHGFVEKLATGAYRQLVAMPYLSISATELSRRLLEAPDRETVCNYLAAAFRTLPTVTVLIDDAELILDELHSRSEFTQIFETFLISARCRLVLVLPQHRLTIIKEKFDAALTSFDILTLDPLSSAATEQLVIQQTPLLAQRYHLRMTRDAIQTIVEFSQQLPMHYALPERALRFFEEVCAATSLQNKSVVERSDVQAVFRQHVGLPALQQNSEQTNRLRQLPDILASHVHGQAHAVTIVAKTVQASWLGLKDGRRPFGSFLFLGPSGVGKTELAKVLAREVFGSEQTFLRLDMSEFAESHNAQRLLGAPPGYVGYEAGGQLTSFVEQHPFSLILLDEIEKAHPSLFDLFLQILDDGRLTDGHGQTIDFTKTIIVATSNVGTSYIVDEAEQGKDITSHSWFNEYLLPLLLERFRPEFINRFSATLVFKPLSDETLLAIAHQELRRLEHQVRPRGITLQFSDDWLRQQVHHYRHPLFGARPLKRFLEQTCENLVTAKLLQL